MVLEEILKHDETFRYQLLSRMVEDCNYYLGYGNRNAKDLWANDEWEQIEIMQALYESFPPEKKPEWLTPDDILGYGERMLTPLGEISVLGGMRNVISDITKI